MLKGIDVSHHDPISLDVTGVDFVIMKATEGTFFEDNTFGYRMSRTPHMLRGCYHFAHGNDPRAEARHFDNVTHKYLGTFAPVLDFEIEISTPVRWCEEFVDEYHTLTGMFPMLYTGAHFPHQNMCALFDDSWIPDVCALWLAGYPAPPINHWIDRECSYPCGKWGKPDIWQFTSTLDLSGWPVDGNLAYMTEAGFEALYGVDKMTVNELLDTKVHTSYGDLTVRDLLAWTYSYTRDIQPVIFDLQKRVKDLEQRKDD